MHIHTFKDVCKRARELDAELDEVRASTAKRHRPSSLAAVKENEPPESSLEQMRRTISSMQAQIAQLVALATNKAQPAPPPRSAPPTAKSINNNRRPPPPRLNESIICDFCKGPGHVYARCSLATQADVERISKQRAEAAAKNAAKRA